MSRWPTLRSVALHCESCIFITNTLYASLTFQSPTKSSKKEKEEVVINVEDLSPIAHPLAQKKLLKKLHKTIKKGTCDIFVLHHETRRFDWIVCLQRRKRVRSSVG